MSMLSIFPELLFLAPLSALVIRATVAAMFALATYAHVRGATLFIYIMAALEAIATLSLAFGYYAQAGALLAALLATAWALLGRPARPYPLTTTLLLIIMCLSLLVTGPGQVFLTLVRPVGFEPTTHCLKGSCSTRLSYGRIRPYYNTKILYKKFYSARSTVMLSVRGSPSIAVQIAV